MSDREQQLKNEIQQRELELKRIQKEETEKNLQYDEIIKNATR